MFIREPSPPQGDANLASFLRTLIQWCRQFRCNGVVGGRKVSDPDGGYHIVVQPGKGGGGGLKFAVPMEFDWINGSYSKDEIVIISTDSPACTAGVNESATSEHGVITGLDGTAHSTDETSQDVATAGMWACLRSPKVLSVTQPSNANDPRNYDLHVPIWPLPEPADVDDAANYWMLIGFIPIERNICNETTGEPEPHYIQTVLKPGPAA